MTTEATRAAADDELLALARARRAEARAAGITHQEIKSGYGLTVESEARLCRLAAELTDDVTFLGAHLVPPEYEGRADDYVAARLRRDARRLRPALALDRRLLRARRLRRRAVARRARRRSRRGPRAAGARQPARPGPRRAARGRDGRRLGRPLHLPRRRRRRGAGRRATRSRPSSRPPTSRPASPIPDARRAIDAGVSVAIATNTNPGSSYTTSMPFCIALAVRELRDDDRRGARRGDHRRRPGAAARRHRPAGARRARRRSRARRAVATPT